MVLCLYPNEMRTESVMESRSGGTPIRTTSACQITDARSTTARPSLPILVGGHPGTSVLPEGMFRAATRGGSPLPTTGLGLRPLRNHVLGTQMDKAGVGTRRSALAPATERLRRARAVRRPRGAVDALFGALPGAKPLGPRAHARRAPDQRSDARRGGWHRGAVGRGRLAAGLGAFVRTGSPSSRRPPRARCPR